MRRLGRRLRSDRTGTAALEFALVLPFIFLLCIGMIDLASYLNKRMQVIQAMDATAQFAVSNGQSVNSTSTAAALLASIDALAVKFSGIGLTVASSYNNTTDGSGYGSNGTAACYCVTKSGNGYGYALASACNALCPDGSAAGQFVAITASYVFRPLFPADSFLTGGTIADAVLVRVQ